MIAYVIDESSEDNVDSSIDQEQPIDLIYQLKSPQYLASIIIFNLERIQRIINNIFSYANAEY